MSGTVGGYAEEGFVGGGVVEDYGLGVFEGLDLGVLVGLFDVVVVVVVVGGGGGGCVVVVVGLGIRFVRRSSRIASTPFIHSRRIGVAPNGSRPSSFPMTRRQTMIRWITRTHIRSRSSRNCRGTKQRIHIL